MPTRQLSTIPEHPNEDSASPAGNVSMDIDRMLDDIDQNGFAAPPQRQTHISRISAVPSGNDSLMVQPLRRRKVNPDLRATSKNMSPSNGQNVADDTVSASDQTTNASSSQHSAADGSIFDQMDDAQELTTPPRMWMPRSDFSFPSPFPDEDEKGETDHSPLAAKEPKNTEGANTPPGSPQAAPSRAKVHFNDKPTETEISENKRGKQPALTPSTSGDLFSTAPATSYAQAVINATPPKPATTKWSGTMKITLGMGKSMKIRDYFKKDSPPDYPPGTKFLPGTASEDGLRGDPVGTVNSNGAIEYPMPKFPSKWNNLTSEERHDRVKGQNMQPWDAKHYGVEIRDFAVCLEGKEAEERKGTLGHLRLIPDEASEVPCA